jgi:hypothetical protein
MHCVGRTVWDVLCGTYCVGRIVCQDIDRKVDKVDLEWGGISS